MQPKPELYSPGWLEAQQYTQEWSSRALLAVFAHLGLPKSMLDLGCSGGHLCRLAAKLGVLSVGLDIALNGTWDNGLCKLGWCDLTQPLRVADFHGLNDAVPGGQFDLVISWEMGEHLPAEDAGIYLDSIARHVGKYLVFTAAAPDQNGDGHVNCQPQEWWRERLQARGLTYLPEQTERLRDTWAWATGPCFWYVQNIQMFERTVRDG